jgi:riboflavin synthase alpha subunit
MNNYTLHKLPEGFIISSDEKPKNGDIVISKINYRKFLFEKGDIIDDISHKVIAQQDQIDFSALSEEEQKEIGWYDTIKFAREEVQNHNNIFFDSKYNMENYGIDRFNAGFQKAQELLSDRRFTLEDMKKATEIALNSSYVTTQHFSGHSTVKHNFTSNEIIQSLSQPKSWKVELEMEYDLESIDSSKKVMKPKLTNGKIKILKLL